MRTWYVDPVHTSISRTTCPILHNNHIQSLIGMKKVWRRPSHWLWYVPSCYSIHRWSILHIQTCMRWQMLHLFTIELPPARLLARLQFGHCLPRMLETNVCVYAKSEQVYLTFFISKLPSLLFQINQGKSLTRILLMLWMFSLNDAVRRTCRSNSV